MVMVITGIVAGIVAAFIARPIQGYVDTVRRAGMSDVADTALRRMAYDIRMAVPNTVRIASLTAPAAAATGLSTCATGASVNCFLEFIPARDGGRYRAQRDGTPCPALATDPHADPIYNVDDCVFAGNPDNDRFDVLGPTVTGANGDFVVIFNTGQIGLDAYQTGVNRNRRTITAAGAEVSFTATTSPYPPFESPFQRFQIVPSTGPVSYGCVAVTAPAGFGGHELRRFTGYRAGTDDWSVQPTTVTGNDALLASDLSTCRFDYQALSASNGLLILRLAITRENETVSLVHEIHVDNTP